MLYLHDISYSLPNKDLLFSNIHLSVSPYDKTALIGSNGSGKSTLLRMVAGELQPSGGKLTLETVPWYVPQIFGQYNHLSVAGALRIGDKLNSLRHILNGDAGEEHFALLQDDWTIDDRCREALQYWQLDGLDLWQPMATLSGGQKTKVFLAGITIHQPALVLLDEPSNHLDGQGRQQLYDFVQSTQCTLVVVSHDRKLLNMLDTVCELGKHGIKVYGGNYDFYAEQKQTELNALNQDIQSRERALRKAREKEQETLERQQKLDNRGKGKQAKAGVPKIVMNAMRNNSENSTSKLRSVHAEKIGDIARNLQDLRSGLPGIDRMKFGFEHSALHKGKILFAANHINFSYDEQPLWTENLTFEIASRERIALKGPNGSGKTTLIKLILGSIEPRTGTVFRAGIKPIYIDQDYSLLEPSLTVYGQAQQFNNSGLLEHEVKIRLNRFLFTREDWNKPCSALSGGERMRLMLCCLTIGSSSPNILMFDEPTNNLDIQNVEILTAAINNFRGTLIVVSHDETFLEEIHIERTISL